ncbi:PHP domain-containing protein [Candidatus Pacearchaeota archaeon]|nr:PHP domain-containing protein [Candidatus Pacearchaeota archaeon]
MKFVDLHNHSIYSDGSDTPETVTRAAVLKGTQVFALSDHDTIAGCEASRREAERWGMLWIPAVEVSTTKYHILGYGFDPANEEFTAFLKHSQHLQEETCIKRLDLLQQHGVPITFEKLRTAFPESRLGKYNLLMTLLLDPECRAYARQHHGEASPDELMGIYLRKGSIAGTVKKGETISSKEAIYQIHQAGGIAILAHPFKQVTDMHELDVLLEKGIDGLEIQPNYGAKNNPFRAYAEAHGMKMTYGSDFHGPSINRPLLGREHNNLINLDALLAGTRWMR